MPSFLDRLRIRHVRLVFIKKKKLCITTFSICDCFCNKAAMDEKKEMENLAAKEGIFSHVELQYIVYVNGRKDRVEWQLFNVKKTVS